MAVEPVRQPTIVVAEDEPNIRNIVCDLLKLSNYQVIECADGDEAFNKIQSALSMAMPIDLLVTDIRMPGMNGLQLIEALEKNNWSIPVLVLTGYGDRDLLIDLLRRGCKEYLDKPFKLDEFLARLAQVLQKENEAREKIRLMVESVEKIKALPKTASRPLKILNNIRLRELGGYAVFDVVGELNDDNAALLRAMAEERLETSNYHLLINLSTTTYISSFGMGVIIYLWKMVREKQGVLHMLSGETRMRKKIEELNLQRVMKLFDSEVDFIRYLEETGVLTRS